MRFSLFIALFGLLCQVDFGHAGEAPADRPLPAKDAAKAFTLPPGFQATLFAGEPAVVQPIAMTFDDRGRLWVVECVSYPRWVTDGKGIDRVVILEDTDGDGVHDRRTLFLDNGVNLSGIAYGFGGVWLCSSPNLVFVPDRNGDDKPDGPAEVLLDGWNIKDTKHNIFNSLGWGPDGWLYGCNGIQAKARVGKPGSPDSERIAFDCGVWRYHPTRKVFETVASGTTNPFGLDWDDYGQIFITNCVIDHLWNVVPGGHYQRMYGQDVNPFTFGLMKSCCDHLHWGGGAWAGSRSTGVNGDPKQSKAGGGHAHSGCLVYLGDNFPPEYRNSVLMCNIHGNRLNRDRLTRTEAGYVARHTPDFLLANDAWFRGICVKSGPDGGLYVSDWSDTGECHNYDRVDFTNGRIFKVVYGTPTPWKGNIATLSDAELVKLQLHKNDWFCRKARRVLHERAVAGKIEADTAQALRTLLANQSDVTRKLRAIWTLHVIGAITEQEIIAAMQNEDDNIRAWGIMLAVDTLNTKPAGSTDAAQLTLQSEIKKRAVQEHSPFVRATFAGVITRLPAVQCMPPALHLAEHAIDPANTNLALMTWFAVQHGLSAQNPVDWLPVIQKPQSDMIRQNAIRYILASASSQDRKSRLEQIVSMLSEAGRSPRDASVLAGMQEAFSGLRDYPEPAGWPTLYRQLIKSASVDVRERAESLAVLFGNKQAIADLTARVQNAMADPKARAAAIAVLTRRKIEGFAPILQGLLGDPAVRGAVIKALATYADTGTPAAILKAYASFTAREKSDAVQTLAARPDWANALLGAIEQGQVPRADVPLVAARQILALNNKATTARLEKTWGKIQPASKEKAAQIKLWKKRLASEELTKADLGKGRMLFAKNCATCHKLFGEGNDIAPDLTGSQRASIDYVLENVLDPSAIVPREFQITNFSLVDGRVVSAIVLKESADGLTVRTVNDTVVIPKGDIEARRQTRQSIMPDGLLEALKPDEVRDLIAYLASPHQVPLPK